jgi:hypothetical protein
MRLEACWWRPSFLVFSFIEVHSQFSPWLQFNCLTGRFSTSVSHKHIFDNQTFPFGEFHDSRKTNVSEMLILPFSILSNSFLCIDLIRGRENGQKRPHGTNKVACLFRSCWCCCCVVATRESRLCRQLIDGGETNSYLTELDEIT